MSGVLSRYRPDIGHATHAQPVEVFVECPEGIPRQCGRRKEVDIHVAQPLSHETVVFDKREHFIVLQRSFRREGFQKRQNDTPVFQVATGKLANNKGVADNFSIIEKVC